jgi:2-methylcitrate dehydratase PrpD
MSGAASVLIDHALSLEWTRLPAAAQQAARTFLHDTLCVGVAGRHAAGADQVFAAASLWSGSGSNSGSNSSGNGCSVLARPAARLSAPYAAFVNAYQIHAQEFDCVHEPAIAHPMATVVAALLAEAERQGSQGHPVSGAEFLTALVAGVDVVATLGVAVTTPLKFFRPATAGVFGSVAALCRLRRLDRGISLNAFGYALAFASGTMQAHLEGKPTLAVQVAAAARSAIEAVDLAVAGMAGPAASIDGPFGYLSLFEDGYDLSAPLASLGKIFRITELSWKPFPTGRAAHGAIVATQQLMREQGISANHLASLTYCAPPLIVRLVGRAAFAGMGTAHARLCFAYLGAVVLSRGTVGLEDFQADKLADPKLLELAQRISVVSDGNPDPAAFVPAVAQAVLHDGRRFEIKVTQQFGSPAWPLSRAEHLAKAQACLKFGGLENVHDALAQTMEQFEICPDSTAGLASLFGR